MIKIRELVLLYDRVIDNLDRDDDNYPRTWNAISRRRDELINRNKLYSKKIKLRKNWYKPDASERVF